jgi:hypothetical protein
LSQDGWVGGDKLKILKMKVWLEKLRGRDLVKDLDVFGRMI